MPNPIASRAGWGFAVLALALAPALARAEDKPLASAETNHKVTAEVYHCKRSEGVLTIKVRLTATADAYFTLAHADTHVLDVGAGKKYELLRDSSKAPIASSDVSNIILKPGQVRKLWWKFPAPPAETKKVTLILPGAEPLEDIPITDAP